MRWTAKKVGTMQKDFPDVVKLLGDSRADGALIGEPEQAILDKCMTGMPWRVDAAHQGDIQVTQPTGEGASLIGSTILFDGTPDELVTAAASRPELATLLQSENTSSLAGPHGSEVAAPADSSEAGTAEESSLVADIADAPEAGSKGHGDKEEAESQQAKEINAREREAIDDQARELEKEGDQDERESGRVNSRIMASVIDTIGGYLIISVLAAAMFLSLLYSVGVQAWTTKFSEDELKILMDAQEASSNGLTISESSSMLDTSLDAMLSCDTSRLTRAFLPIHGTKPDDCAFAAEQVAALSSFDALPSIPTDDVLGATSQTTFDGPLQPSNGPALYILNFARAGWVARGFSQWEGAYLHARHARSSPEFNLVDASNSTTFTTRQEDDLRSFLIVLCALMLFSIVSTVIATLIETIAAIRMSRFYFDKLLVVTLRASQSVHDRIANSRLVSRFSADMVQIDDSLMANFHGLAAMVIQAVGFFAMQVDGSLMLPVDCLLLHGFHTVSLMLRTTVLACHAAGGCAPLALPLTRPSLCNGLLGDRLLPLLCARGEAHAIGGWYEGDSMHHHVGRARRGASCAGMVRPQAGW
jgi:hypothetical protein